MLTLEVKNYNGQVCEMFFQTTQYHSDRAAYSGGTVLTDLIED